jgi:hypothetical protein
MSVKELSLCFYQNKLQLSQVFVIIKKVDNHCLMNKNSISPANILEGDTHPQVPTIQHPDEI